MSNPEFPMQGITFVISATTNAGHPFPFRVRLPNGKAGEIQRSLRASMDVHEVAAELRLLARDLEASATGPTKLDFPAVVQGDEVDQSRPPAAQT
jgi:hypothetical protein